VKEHALGLVSYLNTSPFRYGLRALGQTKWIERVPALLLPLLQSGEVEAAVLPAFDALAHPELPVLPGSAIVSHGAAYSVRLFSRIPLRRVTTVALDASSHTSAALTRIVLGLQGGSPSYFAMSPDLTMMLNAADAALLIGDPCMRANTTGLLVTDLGQEWLRLTGLPFVFAVWAARPGADYAALAELIGEAKRKGLEALERVAEEECERVGLDRAVCLVYLRDHMRYDLDESARAGLERFRELAVKQGLIPDAGPFRLLEIGA
jgi:chorismate dehydratase